MDHDAIRNNTFYIKQDDPEIAIKYYKKKELNHYVVPSSQNITSKEEIAEYRKNTCELKASKYDHQEILTFIFNPQTPVRSIGAIHDPGTGKTCVAISIILEFLDQLEKYNTKAVIVVPGPIIEGSWKSMFHICAKRFINPDHPDDPKETWKNAKRYVTIISKTKFYKKIIGDRVHEDILDEDGGVIKDYKKNKKGEYIRDFGYERLNLSNTILIIDEAHHYTSADNTRNTYGLALTEAIKLYPTMKYLLLSGTPMKNDASDIIEFLNFLRPQNSPIIKSKVFTVKKATNIDDNIDTTMEFTEGGEEYLRNMAKGYISYVKGGDPLLFPEENPIGILINNMKYTKLYPCPFQSFQKDAYMLEFSDGVTIGVSKFIKLRAICSFVFPIIKNNKLEITYGTDGIDQLHSSVDNKSNELNLMISEIVGGDGSNNVYKNNKGKLVGNIFGKHISHFSTKGNELLKILDKYTSDQNGSKKIFIYSNAVRTGVNIIESILLENGYLEYDQNENYEIMDETICYYCGTKYAEHDVRNQEHEFSPAIYFKITGDIGDDEFMLPEEKVEIITNSINSPNNIDGKTIKVVVGSKVVNEGTTFKDIGAVVIYDQHYNLGMDEQVIARAIRSCSHYSSIDSDGNFPQVDIYRFATSLGKNAGPTAEEAIYLRSEEKFIIVKKVERIMQEVAIDCPLNLKRNVDPRDVSKYSGCMSTYSCPKKCGYMECDYKCADKILNNEYYDPKNMMYRLLDKSELDTSTFNSAQIKGEIELAKKIIRNMYVTNSIYDFLSIVDNVKKNIGKKSLMLYDDIFVYRALDSFLSSATGTKSVTGTMKNGEGLAGNLIYDNGYYIFQPLDETYDNIDAVFKKAGEQNMITYLLK